MNFLHFSRRPKYGNTKIAGFDSRREFDRWTELSLLQKAGSITDLERQVPYELIPAQRDQSGKLLERAVVFKADFRYLENGQVVVEDSKGFRTRDYIIKKKLMLWIHGIRLRET